MAIQAAREARRYDSWHIAMYARLSREDRLDGESDSIVGQRRLIESWADTHHASIVASYEDDGYSGANFDRPGFQKMIEDAHRGRFDTIVVKDLSRFGRSYLDCGSIIERELPQLGIRLYSIGDDFDSMRSWDYNTALLFPMKNLMNEMYVANTSEKVRISLKAKRERGECVSNFAPYGYRKDGENRHRLAIDEEAAQIVREVFELKLSGRSASEIARMLNRRGTPCPEAYKRICGSNHSTCFTGDGGPRWHAKTVLRILRNEVYTGNLVQGKTRRPSWRLHRSLPLPRDMWSIADGAHEPIIDMETFRAVNALLDAQTEPAAPTKPEPNMPPNIILLCGGCQGRMSRSSVISNGRRYTYYTCSTHRRMVNRCSPHSIREENLLKQLKLLLASYAGESGLTLGDQLCASGELLYIRVSETGTLEPERKPLPGFAS